MDVELDAEVNNFTTQDYITNLHTIYYHNMTSMSLYFIYNTSQFTLTTDNNA